MLIQRNHVYPNFSGAFAVPLLADDPHQSPILPSFPFLCFLPLSSRKIDDRQTVPSCIRDHLQSVYRQALDTAQSTSFFLLRSPRAVSSLLRPPLSALAHSKADE